jgi:hypothetical protein
MKNTALTLFILLTGYMQAYPQCNTALIISQGRPAFASSQEGPAYDPGNAFDGDRTTRWSSAFSDPQYLYVDLGAVTTLCQVNLIWEAAYGKDFTIDISDDALTWTTVATITGNTSLTNDMPISGNGRYVRMNGTARGTGNGYSLFGMHVYGTAPSPLCGGTDLALGGTAVSSSDESIAFPAFQAFDGHSATRWSSQASDPQSIYVDLGTTYNLCTVMLNWEAAYGRDFNIDVSQDAADWATLVTVTGNTSTADTIPVSGLARYVRMFGTARATGYGYSLYEFTVNGYIALPIKLSEFKASDQGNNTISLQWTTDQEVNNANFTIERSSGATPFSSIGLVRGKGSSSIQTKYSWVDSFPAAGINKYRLKQVDLDGNSSYSPIAPVTMNKSERLSVSVYPNPAIDHLTVAASGTEKIESVRVFNFTGAQLMEQRPAPATTLTLSLQQLPAGLYTIRVDTNRQTRVMKFLKSPF